MSRDLQIEAGPIFLRNYESKARITINRGGSSSGKTGSLIRLFLLWLMTGRIDKERHFETGTLSIVRKYGSNLRTSVQRDFEGLLTEYNLWGQVKVNKSDRTYKYQGRMIEFIGIDDPQKARGPRREILYCNEGNELNWEDYFQLSIRTTYKIFIDFNPDDEDVWINTELEQARALAKGDVNVIVSTYRDNPFLNDEIRDEIEALANRNPEYYKIYGLGQYGRLEGLIFTFSDIDSVPEGAEFIGYGQDFGFTNDPAAFLAVYKWNGGLILDEMFYATGMLNSDIVREYRALGVGKTQEIFADSSEPKSIEEIFRSGFNIKGVEKGPDSVKFGIDLMKEYPLYVTKRSHNTRKELKKYIWDTDKNGKPINKPIDKWNHAIDAARYLIFSKLKKQATKTVFVKST